MINKNALFRTTAAIALSILSVPVVSIGALAEEPPASQQASPDPSGGGLDEVIVTASKTGATGLQKTPIAVSAFTGDELKLALSDDIKDLARFSPSVSIAQESTNAEVYIRGIGSNNPFAGSDPDVTMQSDGVYLARPSEQFGQFLDVERVEVLRGPQGTLYGRNAVGGTINIISKTPSDIVTGQEELTVGNYGEVQNQAYISGPLIPGQLQASLAINYERHDPYLKNIAPGGNGIADANDGGMRGQVRYEASPDITATTRFDWSQGYDHGETRSSLLAPLKGAPLANSTIGSYSEVALNSPQNSRFYNGGISEDIDWTLDPHLSLKSITAYRQDFFDFNFDADASEINFETSRQQEREHEITQELNLQMHYADFEGVVGFFYFHEVDDAYPLASVFPTPFIPSPPRQELIQAFPHTSADAEAGFAQGTYHLLSDLAVTVGYRYTIEQKSLEQDYQKLFVGPPQVAIAPYPFIGDTTRDFHGITPKFGLDWTVTPDALLYFSATRGYKSGGLNYAAPNVLSESFNPESIWSYEVGAKTEWFDHRLRINLSGFLYDYNNLQVQTLLAPAVVSIGNAATATIKGAEAEFKFKPEKNWLLTSNFTVLDANYDSFADASVASTLVPWVASSPLYDRSTGTFNAAGKRLDAAPHVTAFLAAQRNWDLPNGDSVYLRGEYSWQTRVYYDPTNVNILSQGAYGIGNMSLGYNLADGGWQAQLWVKNIADKGYIISAAANTPAPVGLVGTPRTFGMRLTASF
jgi:iron complex outermembrane receptor protein